MKYVNEFRNAAQVKSLAQEISSVVTRPWCIMEVCGGQTHAIVRFGLQELLPSPLTLLHGPGCPVCVTPMETVDKALAIAARPEVIFCSFGDMVRVPGSKKDLASVKAAGGDVRIVYSPLDALALARRHPEKQVVFFAVGFETTAPANAMAVAQAREAGLKNFSLLLAQVRVPPALEAILSSPGNRVQGFLAAGHVCAVMGEEEYHAVAQRYRVPIVITGFEPVDVLWGLLRCVRQLEEGRFEVENAYGRSVRSQGNPAARRLMEKVFQVTTRRWRGVGEFPFSGLGFRPDWQDFDAEVRFPLPVPTAQKVEGECRAGEVLMGALKPTDCPAFGVRCTPDFPLGAPMVSNEGACAAYYHYRQREKVS